MAETLGSLTDKISIIQLKIFHMKEQLERKDAGEDHKEAVRGKLRVMDAQKKDLEDELTELFYGVAEGRATLKIYRQFKMYNDPAYRKKRE